MPHRFLFALLASCAWLAAASAAAAQPAVVVYGLELEIDAERERVLIFADGPLEPGLIEVDERTLMIALPGAVLDPTAPTRLTPERQGTLRRITAFERAEGGRPEVRVVVQRRPGAAPRIERRESVIALDFEPLPRAAAAPDETVSIAYRRAPLPRVVREIARATGETIVFDQTLSGQVTIEGPTRASPAEALAILDSLLLLRELAAVPAPGGARKIVPISGAEGRWVRELPEGDELVATLLRVESVRADDVFAALSSFFGGKTTGVVFAPTNSLILAGPASMLRRIRTAVEALDRLELTRPIVWRLRYADAEVVAGQLEEILGSRAVPYVSVQPEANAVVLRARPDELERARRLVDRLDRPARGGGELHVLPLHHADPVRLAEQLVALRDDEPLGDAEALSAEARFAGLRGRGFVVSPDEPTNALVVQAAPEVFGALLDVVRELDRAPDAVRIDLTLASVMLDSGLDIGVDFLIPTLTDPKKLTDPIVSVISNSSGGGVPATTGPGRPFLFNYTRSPLLIPIINPVTGLPDVLRIPRESASLSLNGREVRTQTLMQPRLLVTSGDEHELFAGDNVPIRVSQAEPGTDVVEVRQDIQRQDVGTRVRVAPVTGAEGVVQLEIEIEQSSVSESLTGDTATVGPTIRTVQVQSTIRLRSGDTAVLATATEPVSTRSETGVPWLKDIPFFGQVFRRNSESEMKSYLLIAVSAERVGSERAEVARALAHELSRVEAAEASAVR